MDEYPESFESYYDIRNFALDVWDNLSRYTLIKKGERKDLQFDPIAIRRMGFLLEQEADYWFGKGNKMMNYSLGFVQYFNSFNYLDRPGKEPEKIKYMDHLMLHIHLAGKELQRFEELNISELENLVDFCKKLYGTASSLAGRWDTRHCLTA